MKNYKLRHSCVALSIALSLVLVVGCQSNSDESVETQPIELDDKVATLDSEIEDKLNVTDVSSVSTSEETVEKEIIEVPEEPTGYYNPLTGLYVDESVEDRRVIAVMQDNHYDARPQAGVSQADIVFEILAEGRITRYMAIYYGEYPEHIGGVRSARPYFINRALEFDPYYVHAGGSDQAFIDIKNLNMADIDGLASGACWRVDHKFMPHNMYTSGPRVVQDGNRQGHRTKADFSFVGFNESFEAIGGDKANSLKIVYKEPDAYDSQGYYTSYKYNDEEKVYYRYTNDTPYIDENNNEQIKCSNIILQYANHYIIDNYGRRAVEFIGEGTGKFFSAGEVIDITWKKDSRRAKTYYYDANGVEINLNPGQTWIQVVEMNGDVTIQ